MVLSGIKVKIIYYEFFCDWINKGEANTGYNVDQYVCTFSKMIQYWRQTWNERTNGITDPQFPFGFVQVRFIQIHMRLEK
jgi:hypothetical protein